MEKSQNAEFSRMQRVKDEPETSYLSLILRDAGNAYDFSRNNFVQHVRCELERAELGDYRLQTDYIRRLLLTTQMRNTMKIGLKLSIQTQRALVGANIVIPPVFVCKRGYNVEKQLQLINQHSEVEPITTNLVQISADVFENRGTVKKMMQFAAFQE